MKRQRFGASRKRSSSPHHAFNPDTQDEPIVSGAMKAAADFIGKHRSSIPSELVPTTATQLAVMAFELHKLFINENEHGVKTIATPPASEFNAALAARRWR